ncbi:depolymerase [Marinobacterium nitratireducens]|uniref:Depolymerase n=1 Tax=Marinobacterium nitratireducens TaxID=518897 RepID=A0A918DT83_9GAMM|nr:poly(3-hydroxybutyrate) depolymerase [Marinobacterium nitratireducens]GGO81360.1 depolymerase [Marinobacterium nitratireducens]
MKHFDRLLRLRLLSLLVLILAVMPPAEAARLPGFGADISKTSVSGLSSGAFMTSQIYVAFSDIMVGAGIVAGGPYLCAKSWAGNSLLTNATTACMNPLTPSVGPNTPHLVALTRDLASSGAIDPIENLADDHLYIFSGKSDTTVTTAVVDQTAAYYEALGVPASSIRYDTSVNAGHAIITDENDDTDCSKTKEPYVNDCGFEQSNIILNQIYGSLNPPADTLSSEIMAFDQSEFIDAANTSMSDTAYAYVPAVCKTHRSCPVHVVLHGCEQGAAVIDPSNKYYAQTGYNQMAEANDIIMLYPQVQPSNAAPVNPKGCWDFWGYSSPQSADPDYFTQNAPQLRAIRSMIDRLAEPVTTISSTDTE